MAHVRPASSAIRNFEDVLEKTGWGLYYKFIVGYASASSFVNAITLLSMSFALPVSSCYGMLLSENVLVLHTYFAVGKACGGFLATSLSDNSGKKCMIPKTFIVLFGSSFVAAFSHSALTLYISAFFLGSGLQGSMVCVKIYLCEVLPVNKRGFYMVLPDVCWCVGYFAISVPTYFFANFTAMDHRGMDMRITAWRAIYAVSGGLSLVMACVSALLEMAPRFLLFKKRTMTAVLVLKQFYAINRSKYSETFDLRPHQLHNLIKDYNLSGERDPINNFDQTMVSLKTMFRMVRLLFRRKFITTLIAIVVMKLPVLFGVLGTTILFSQLLLWDENANVRGESLLRIATEESRNCTITVNHAAYQNFFLLSMNMLFGQVLLLLVIDRVRRKISICLALVLCGVTSLIMAFIKNFAVGAVAASFFTAGYTIAESTIFVLTTEVFPTSVRGTAAGLINFYVLLAACIVYHFLDIPAHYFLLILGSLLLGASVICKFVPDLRGQPMVE